MPSKALAFLVTIVAVAAVGCGKSVTDAQQADVAALVGGVTNASSKPSFAAPSSGVAAPGSLGQLIRTQVNSALWLAKFKVESGQAVQSQYSIADAQPVDPLHNALTIGTCPTTSSSAGGATCTPSCPTTSSLKIACTSTASTTSKCGTTTYTISSLGFSITFDLANVTGSTSSMSSATGTMGLTVGFSGNVTGGNLDGKALACTIGLTFDIAKVEAGTAQTPTLSCDNFSCTYDSVALDCTKVQSGIGSTSCS